MTRESPTSQHSSAFSGISKALLTTAYFFGVLLVATSLSTLMLIGLIVLTRDGLLLGMRFSLVTILFLGPPSARMLFLGPVQKPSIVQSQMELLRPTGCVDCCMNSTALGPRVYPRLL